jgi:phosphoribosyl 1,2-cyclic phosphate phosphodiesterase
MIACGCTVCRSADRHDKRLRSSILVESAETTFVIDTGPDFRYQMLRIGQEQLDAVLFTHSHKDHTAGLDDIRAYNFFQQKDMPLYASEATARAIRNDFAYAFAEHKYPGVPAVTVHVIDETPFMIGDIPVQPILVWHLKMPVYGFRMGNFTYITDANRIEPGQLEKIRGSRVLVLNALRHEPHISHFTLSEAREIVQDLQVPQALFTHISHQLGLHHEVNATLPEGMRLAYDGLRITV